MTTTDDLAHIAPPPNASLTEVQLWLARLIRHQRSLNKSEPLRRAATVHVSGNDRLSAAEQIDIYRKQFWLRHTSLLIEDFPGVTTLLGQERWEQIAESYLCEHGYEVIALRDLGKGLPAHLGAQGDLESVDLLVDMARLECAYLDAFDARDDPALSAEKVSQIPLESWPMAVLRTASSVRLLEVSYPVADVRRALRADPSSVDASSVERRPQNLVVYRRDHALFDKALSRPAFLLLERLTRGMALIPACESVVAVEPEAARVFDEELMEWFSLWGRLGWIVDVSVP